MVNRETGIVVRNITNSKADFSLLMKIHAHENMLLLVVWQSGRYKCVHVYENEIHKRTLQLVVASDNNFSFLCGTEYLLLGISGNKIAIVDLSQSGSRAKFESIQLGQMAFFNRLFWIARDDEKSGQGYLFTSDSYEDHLSNRSYVYEMNLKNVVNGTTLLPMQIPFMSCYGNKNILFECALGTDLIFCMCGKNVFAEKTFMVKLLANL